ncbi:terminase ATPase subunit family protein [Chitinimonas sp. BJB300]|uniref:terminase ATPase subunit family protein n=1 Tax=Chitinimonas sp. BJB300 TaxID=1559339 RepID=UPI000C120DED|nr:terminase ATPase subunit family protein [Chitinimonas sp. BJB300]PHV11337.1 oxidoreductase [Chitinimonas sp. BJB300]TSJ88222.1 terminase ATPase subunit family protein [Chitinimonas sp. BJB300]
MTKSPTLDTTQLDPRRYARALYWQGWRVGRIAEHLGEKATTVHSWKRRDEWDMSDAIDRVEASLECRMQQLISKETKDGADYKEIDLLGRQLERAARVRKYSNGGNEADLNPNVANRNKGPRKPPERNAITEAQQAQLVACFMDSMFAYQREWHEAGKKQRFRNLLKSRQIGATYYFAREALIDALQTGRNQVFLSASKAQAHQFKSYIVDFAKEVGIELRGDPIKLPNGAELIFLGTNSRTAQSYHGNLYVDEYFWIPRFQELRKVAGAMASHAKWRTTFFSTPSALSHEAYPFWSGKLFNKGRPKSEHITLDVSHAALAGGRRCEDGQWRQIVTIQDATARGCNLFDIEQLKLENSADEFAQLFMCEFIDDGQSVFPFAMLQRCMVDSWTEWHDFKPFAARPFGYRPVWVGYDPAHTGDSAGLVVIAPPLVAGGKFRVLAKYQFNGLDFAEQAAKIKQITETYNVTHIGIDTTGIGQGVFQLVKQFFPMVKPFNYSVDVKTRLVLKALDVISHGRFEFDAGWTDLAAAFMAIRKTITPSGRQATFEASRSEEVSHADLAWACMHALANEPLEGMSPANSGFMEIF